MMRIGTVELKDPVILAPMAGVTDLPFRLLCSRQGAGMVCTEMVSAKAILYRNRNTKALMKLHPQEHPVSLQLFGSDPDIISVIAKQIEELPFDILDINMGCPVPKVTSNGEGSALMQNPHLAGQIIEKTARAIRKPVTVKIRKGFSEENVNAVEIAHIAQESGAAAVTLHARTREQFYSGKADWGCIRRVKEAVSIPVIGNGDVNSPQAARRMLEETGCDAVMIGRAARGNPWIFRQCAEYLSSGRILARPGKQEVLEMILCHASMLLEEKGEYTGVREMRKHISWYTAGFPDSARLRAAVNEALTYEQLRALLFEFFL